MALQAIFERILVTFRSMDPHFFIAAVAFSIVHNDVPAASILHLEPPISHTAVINRIVYDSERSS